MLATNATSGRTAALLFEGKNQFSVKPLPLIAVPTTCGPFSLTRFGGATRLTPSIGTGSEVTWVSVLTDESQRRKFSVKGDLMFPSAAIVDAHVLRSLPQKLIAYTGVDALTHALEATLSRPGVANCVSDSLAEDAVVTLLANLCAAAGGGDDDALAAVARASTMAGLAFGNADVGAVHCLS